MATFVPINPRTRLPYKDGRKRKGSWTGIVGGDGELKSVHTHPFDATIENIVQVEERTDVRTLQSWMRRIGDPRRIVPVDRKGHEIHSPRAGQQIRWATDDGRGNLWLLQPPEFTPETPGRSRGRDPETNRVVRGKSPGRARIKSLQPYSLSAHRWMQDSVNRDPRGHVTLFVDSDGRIAGPSRSRHQVSYRLDAKGLDTEMHEMLAWVKWSPYELALLNRDVNVLADGEWTDWFKLDDETSIRDSLGRMGVELTDEHLAKLRDDPATFVNIHWECRMNDPQGHSHLLGHALDTRKDTEMLVKQVARDICHEMFKVGYKHTRSSVIRAAEGMKPDAELRRLVPVERTRGWALMRKYEGTAKAQDGAFPMGALDDAISGKVRFKVVIDTKTRRSYAAEINRTQKRTGYNRAAKRLPPPL